MCICVEIIVKRHLIMLAYLVVPYKNSFVTKSVLKELIS